ncbi:MAG: potassium channel family protein [Verrucomicrobiota bacterium JB023]|nr:potassium channel family protein [Verrucomicrobiota bacterium JB023]
MNLVLTILGILLILFTTFDVLKTTISFSGGGPMSRTISAWVWWVHVTISRRFQLCSLRRMVGCACLLASVGLWVLLLYAGYALIFSAWDGAVVDSTTKEPAALIARIYYTGFTLFTLGVGDYVPGGPLWMIVTAVASFHGLFLITLSITYLISVVSAVVDQHALGGMIRGFGETSSDILHAAWNGKDFRDLEPFLATVSERLETHSQRHLAYPIIHNFPSHDPREALPVRLLALHEATWLASRGSEEQSRLNQLSVRAVLNTFEAFLDKVDRFDEESDKAEVGEVGRGARSLPIKPELVIGDPAFEQQREILLRMAGESNWLLQPLVLKDGDC